MIPAGWGEERTRWQDAWTPNGSYLGGLGDSYAADVLGWHGLIPSPQLN